MERCDVLIIGGGPAGSTCAWKLHQAGLDVIVMDKAAFPRDKVCAGWVTPQAVADLDLDLEDYRRGRTLQPITGFRVGVIGNAPHVDVTYGRPVSFGIRRCEFDHYLLTRSQATLRLGEPARSIRRDGRQWVVNDAITASVLVGAGGHFCPVARMLNPAGGEGPLIVAQEAEFPIDASGSDALEIDAQTPELYFSRDLKGYGWRFRKQGYLNVGIGRMDRGAFPRAVQGFVSYLRARNRLGTDDSVHWRGHAYLLSEPRHRRVRDEGVMLIGDAAGLAYPQSGEGIRSAIESGLLAATTIVHAVHERSSDASIGYDKTLDARVGRRSPSSLPSLTWPSALMASVGAAFLRFPWFIRLVVINQWFLRLMLLVTLIATLLPGQALAQGGPPLITDDPDTPGPGYWEINIAAMTEKTRSERRLEVPRVDLNYGVGRRIQLKFEMPWVASYDEQQRTETGAGNATAGVKWRFIGQEGEQVAWSIYPQLDFNTAHSSVTKGIEEDGRRFLMPTELTVEMFHLEVNGEVGRSFIENGSDGWIFGLSTEGHVLPRLELLADLHGERTDGVATDLILIGGGRLKLTSTMIVLLAIGHSIMSPPGPGPRTYAYMGLQLNMPEQFTFATESVRPPRR